MPLRAKDGYPAGYPLKSPGYRCWVERAFPLNYGYNRCTWTGSPYAPPPRYTGPGLLAPRARLGALFFPVSLAVHPVFDGLLPGIRRA